MWPCLLLAFLDYKKIKRGGSVGEGHSRLNLLVWDKPRAFKDSFLILKAFLQVSGFYI